MSAALVQLENHTAGDTWQGIPVIGPVLINGLQPGVAAARVRMSLVRKPLKTGASMQFDSDAGDDVFPITIVDADTWEFMVPPVAYSDFSLPAGDYEGHLEVTDASGERITLYDLRLTVEPDKNP